MCVHMCVCGGGVEREGEREMRRFAFREDIFDHTVEHELEALVKGTE